MDRFCGLSAPPICKQIPLTTEESVSIFPIEAQPGGELETNSGIELPGTASLGLFSANAKSVLYNKPLRL